MNEFMQYAIFILGLLTVIKLFIANSFEIIELIIFELNKSIMDIKKLIKNIQKK